eukprot:Rmarinus@m.18036
MDWTTLRELQKIKELRELSEDQYRSLSLDTKVSVFSSLFHELKNDTLRNCATDFYKQWRRVGSEDRVRLEQRKRATSSFQTVFCRLAERELSKLSFINHDYKSYVSSQSACYDAFSYLLSLIKSGRGSYRRSSIAKGSPSPSPGRSSKEFKLESDVNVASCRFGADLERRDTSAAPHDLAGKRVRKSSVAKKLPAPSGSSGPTGSQDSATESRKIPKKSPRLTFVAEDTMKTKSRGLEVGEARSKTKRSSPHGCDKGIYMLDSSAAGYDASSSSEADLSSADAVFDDVAVNVPVHIDGIPIPSPRALVQTAARNISRGGSGVSLTSLATNERANKHTSQLTPDVAIAAEDANSSIGSSSHIDDSKFREFASGSGEIGNGESVRDDDPEKHKEGPSAAHAIGVLRDIARRDCGSPPTSPLPSPMSQSVLHSETTSDLLANEEILSQTTTIPLRNQKRSSTLRRTSVGRSRSRLDDGRQSITPSDGHLQFRRSSRVSVAAGVLGDDAAEGAIPSDNEDVIDDCNDVKTLKRRLRWLQQQVNQVKLENTVAKERIKSYEALYHHLLHSKDESSYSEWRASILKSRNVQLERQTDALYGTVLSQKDLLTEVYGSLYSITERMTLLLEQGRGKMGPSETKVGTDDLRGCGICFGEASAKSSSSMGGGTDSKGARIGEDGDLLQISSSDFRSFIQWAHGMRGRLEAKQQEIHAIFQHNPRTSRHAPMCLQVAQKVGSAELSKTAVNVLGPSPKNCNPTSPSLSIGSSAGVPMLCGWNRFAASPYISVLDVVSSGEDDPLRHNTHLVGQSVSDLESNLAALVPKLATLRCSLDALKSRDVFPGLTDSLEKSVNNCVKHVSACALDVSALAFLLPALRPSKAPMCSSFGDRVQCRVPTAQEVVDRIRPHLKGEGKTKEGKAVVQMLKSLSNGFASSVHSLRIHLDALEGELAVHRGLVSAQATYTRAVADGLFKKLAQMQGSKKDIASLDLILRSLSIFQEQKSDSNLKQLLCALVDGAPGLQRVVMMLSETNNGFDEKLKADVSRIYDRVGVQWETILQEAKESALSAEQFFRSAFATTIRTPPEVINEDTDACKSHTSLAPAPPCE